MSLCVYRLTWFRGRILYIYICTYIYTMNLRIRCKVFTLFYIRFEIYFHTNLYRADYWKTPGPCLWNFLSIQLKKKIIVKLKFYFYINDYSQVIQILVDKMILSCYILKLHNIVLGLKYMERHSCLMNHITRRWCFIVLCCDYFM